MIPERKKVIALQTYAGLFRYSVEIVGETPKRYKVKILSESGFRLPGKRWAKPGDVVQVPKHAVKDID